MKRIVLVTMIAAFIVFATLVNAESSLIYNSFNADGTSNGPTIYPVFEISTPMEITAIANYHWNNGAGVNASMVNGTIRIDKIVNGEDTGSVGTWKATSSPGAFGNPYAYWWVYPNVILYAGSYKIVDSDQATWSYTTTDSLRFCDGTDHRGKDWEPYKGMSLVYAQPAPVPIPGAVWLLGSGLLGILGLRRKFSI